MRFPSLKGRTKVAVDTETNGLDRHGDSIPIGCSVHAPSVTHYFAWGHPSGNNCTRQEFQKWAKRELRDKQATFVNPSLDIHMLDKIGVNLESQAIAPRCVQYKCALLDEYRNDYSLSGMSSSYLDKQKHELPEMPWLLPGDQVAEYAKMDAKLTYDLDEYFEPLIVKNGLSRVARLEDDLIYCTLHMERQGARIDLEKLARWDREVSLEIERREAAFGGLNVNSGDQLAEAFDRMGIQYDFTAKDNPCFKEDKLIEYRVRNADRPEVAAFCDQIIDLKAIRSIRAKYTGPYLKGNLNGRIYYNLHQCRATDSGTVSGRFSSSDFNIQQVASEENLAEAVRQWVIRELFLPEDSGLWCSADASQIEFRLFAHYADSARIIGAYRRDPWSDFHELVAEMSGLSRKPAKNLNFAKIYGAGLVKTAFMMKASLAQAETFSEKYDNEFPEAKQLLGRAMRIARVRGYVKTILGRLAHFPERRKLHSALNRVIQGTAADIMKLKLSEIYRNMKQLEFNLQFTVHDSVEGTHYNPSKVTMLEDLLNSPCIPVKVPILWKVGTGNNWREASK